MTRRRAEATRLTAPPSSGWTQSNAFVPTRTMPGPLRAYANHQPVSATVSAVRALVIGGPTAGKIVSAFAWTIAISIVFAVLAVRRYRRAA